MDDTNQRHPYNGLQGHGASPEWERGDKPVKNYAPLRIGVPGIHPTGTTGIDYANTNHARLNR